MKIETRPLNRCEAMLYDKMLAGGWSITKRGWPDFLATKGDRLVAIEVKPKRGSKLKGEQLKVLNLLSRMGVECYMWSLKGFQPLSLVIESLNIESLRQRARTRNRRITVSQPKINRSLGLGQARA